MAEWNRSQPVAWRYTQPSNLARDYQRALARDVPIAPQGLAPSLPHSYPNRYPNPDRQWQPPMDKRRHHTSIMNLGKTPIDRPGREAVDLKSAALWACGFESHSPYQRA